MEANQAWYWLGLPFIVLASAYAYSAGGFVAGQAAFTVFAVFLFCILLPQQRHVGISRVEDIAIGGAVSLVVGSLRNLGERVQVRLQPVGKRRTVYSSRPPLESDK
jgi:hypothetical protein